jgi:uncharacterized phage protein (TIGR01671 family)
MREIRFRGMNEETGDFVYGYYTKLVEGVRLFDAIIADEDGELVRYYIHKPKTIGQYTGLTDRNGKPIYEGDIVKFFKNGKWFGWGSVHWDEDTAGFMHRYQEVYDGEPETGCFRPTKRFWGVGYISFEVCGDIHTNPDLLEG